MQTKQKLLYAIITGGLLSAGWPYIGSITPVLFIALLPLLWIDLGGENKRKPSFVYPYISFLIWNLVSTYWLYNVEGGFVTKFFSFLMPSLLNAAIMALVWMFALRVSQKSKINMRLITLMCFWLAYEYFHLDWDLSWPWLQLGNAFALNTKYFQFYEYTGVLGGTMWVLLANFTLLKFALFAIGDVPKKSWVLFRGIASVAMVCVPLWWSLSLHYTPSENQEKINVALLQPNIDPYTEKFSGKSHQLALQDLFDQIDEKAPNAELYVFPETTLQEPSRLTRMGDDFEPVGLWENNIAQSYSARVLRTQLVFGKNADVLIGMSADSLMPKGTEASFVNRSIPGTGLFYQSYNAALFQSKLTDAYYNKSKLVPGVEQTPFASFFKYFKSVALDLGGTTGSLGTQDTRTVFASDYKNYSIAPIICYESIYGDYVGEFVRNGADVLGVITNDAWWAESAGHKQHLLMSKLRAVENRRWLVRSANTGISAFIDPNGEIISQSKYNEKTVLTQDVYTETQLTFYTRFGDYIGRLASFMVILLVLVNISKRLRKVKNDAL